MSQVDTYLASLGAPSISADPPEEDPENLAVDEAALTAPAQELIESWCPHSRRGRAEFVRDVALLVERVRQEERERMAVQRVDGETYGGRAALASATMVLRDQAQAGLRFDLNPPTALVPLTGLTYLQVEALVQWWRGYLERADAAVRKRAKEWFEAQGIKL